MRLDFLEFHAFMKGNMPRKYLSEFRRRVFDLVRSCRLAAEVASDMDGSDQTIHSWRNQELDDLRTMNGGFNK